MLQVNGARNVRGIVQVVSYSVEFKGSLKYVFNIYNFKMTKVDGIENE